MHRCHLARHMGYRIGQWQPPPPAPEINVDILMEYHASITLLVIVGAEGVDPGFPLGTPPEVNVFPPAPPGVESVVIPLPPDPPYEFETLPPIMLWPAPLLNLPVDIVPRLFQV